MFKSIIVDDEKINSQFLRKLIESHIQENEVEIVGEYHTISDAYDAILEHEDLIIFLDIELGYDKNGFELFDFLKDRNDAVIIVSAYSKYAVQAFRFEVLDFLSKPVRISELKEAVKRAKIKLSQQQHTHPNQIEKPNKLELKLFRKTLLVDFDDVTQLTSDGLKTNCQLRNGEVLHSIERLGIIEEKLISITDFIRINKTVIINCKFAKSYWIEDKQLFIEINNNVIPVSRRRKKDVLDRIATKNLA